MAALVVSIHRYEGIIGHRLFSEQALIAAGSGLVVMLPLAHWLIFFNYLGNSRSALPVFLYHFVRVDGVG